MRAICSTLLFLGLATALFAVDINGRWWGKATVEGSTALVYLTLIREGNTIRGTGGPTKVDQEIILNGNVIAGRFVFDVAPGGHTPLHFELTADGEKLKGTVTARREGQLVAGPVLLTRRTND